MKLLLASLFLTVTILSFWGTKVFATGIHNSNGEYGEWEDTSSCKVECGQTEGYKTQQRVCEYDRGENECKPEKWECPKGYNEHNDVCRKFDWQEREWIYANKVKTQEADVETNEEVPCSIKEEEVVACPKEPEPTPRSEQPLTQAGAPICNDGGVPKYAPTVTYAWRTGTDLDVRWTTTDTNDFVLYYGSTGKDFVWNTGRISGQEMIVHNVDQMVDVIACSVSKCGAENCGVRFVDP